MRTLLIKLFTNTQTNHIYKDMATVKKTQRVIKAFERQMEWDV